VQRTRCIGPLMNPWLTLWLMSARTARVITSFGFAPGFTVATCGAWSCSTMTVLSSFARALALGLCAAVASLLLCDTNRITRIRITAATTTDRNQRNHRGTVTRRRVVDDF